MTYYDEFGVGAKASVEEIRKAYKRLARLLHPDKQQEKAARHVAECQMRRLNGVYKTLTDARLRREYDRSLEPPPTQPRPAEKPGADDDAGEDELHWIPRQRAVLDWVRGPNGVWAGASCIVLFMLLYTLFDVSRAPASHVENQVALHPERPAVAPRPVQRGREDAVNIPAQMQHHHMEELQARINAAQMRVAELERQLKELSAHQEARPVASLGGGIGAAGNSGTAPSRDTARAVHEGIAPAPAGVPAESTLPERSLATVTGRRGLGGSWFFARTPGRGTKAPYAAEYIEAVIKEDGGLLEGRYRARYLVTDRAISPEVVFHFSGPGSADGAKLSWLASGGAKGEVRLRLLTENTLEIAWVASELGSMGLGSGSAVLVRRDDRQ